MSEKQFQTRLSTHLRAVGYWVRQFTDLPTNFAADSGVGDTLVMHNGRAAYIECKQAEGTFTFSSLKPNQRAFGHMMQDEHGIPYYVAIRLGSGAVNAADTLKRKRAWLLPLEVFEATEAKALADCNRKSIPYMLTTKSPKVTLKHEFSAMQQWQQWELSWQPGGQWGIGFEHPIRIWFNHLVPMTPSDFADPVGFKTDRNTISSDPLLIIGDRVGSYTQLVTLLETDERDKAQGIPSDPQVDVLLDQFTQHFDMRYAEALQRHYRLYR